MTQRLLFSTLFASIVFPLFGQNGTSADPFTTLSQAQTISAPGVYHFDLGTSFATYVDAEGYVQVALDFGNGTGTLPVRQTLQPTARGILSAATLATLTDALSIRISSSVAGTLDASTTNTTMVQRLLANQTLFQDARDNALNDEWTGTGAHYLTADADPAQRQDGRGLPNEVYHVFYNTAGLHWYPQRGDQGLGYQNEIAATEKLTLWVRAADHVYPPGSAENPFTSLEEAALVTTAGAYAFELDGTTFSTYVDAEGYVQIAIDYGTQQGNLPQVSELDRSARGILPPAALSSLGGITRLRMSSSAGDLDATSSNTGLVERLRNNLSLMSGQADNAINNDWTGTGAGHLTADATRARDAQPLHEEIFHGYYSNGGLHWIPKRGDQALTYSNNVGAGVSYTLWVHGGCQYRTDSPTVSLEDFYGGLCSSTATVTVPAPVATDVCGLQVVGTTSDPVTFSTAGTYTISWTFTDDYGRTTTAVQTAIIEATVLSLPLRETVESGSPYLSCWATASGSNDSEGGWTINSQVGGAEGTARAFYLPPAATGVPHNDYLLSPTYALVPGTEYELSFYVRSEAAENFRILLIDAETFTVTKQLSYDAALTDQYELATIIFEVATGATYRLAFGSSSSGGRQGLSVDEIGLEVYVPPTAGGEELLAGDDTGDNCISGTGRGVNGDAWTKVYAGNGNGKLLLAINANGNDLGDVTVEMTDYSDAKVAPFTGTPLAGRYFNIVPENGPGPYTNGGGVRVRLYFKGKELSELRKAYSRNFDWADLTISHYDGVNTDCQVDNSSDAEFEFLDVVATGDYGGSAQYLEFFTTSFSEFGAASTAAAPVTLIDFTARSTGAQNHLDWQVIDEIDFSHYVVERRTDDNPRFADLATVTARGWAQYTYSDATPPVRAYYRLRMVDHDGSYTHSPLVSVMREQASTGPVLSAFPVPTSGRLTVNYRATATGAVRLRLTDSYGRLLRSETLQVRRGENSIDQDLGGLAAGTYQLSIAGNTVRVMVR